MAIIDLPLFRERYDMRSRLAWPALFLVGIFVCGCSSGSRSYPVKGVVTFDGEPVPNGDIMFVEEDGSIAPDAGKIVNGKYDMQVKGGKKRVEIRASKEVPGAKGLMGPALEDYIPSRYNSRTELSRDVTSQGPNQFDFKLKSGKDE